MKTYEEILKAKIDYYGRTEAAYQFAAEEFSNMNVTEQLRLHNVMQWVAIEDKLPPIEVDVLVWDELLGYVHICNRLDEDGAFFWDESTQILDNVTYWMYLPKPPCA